jgi:hypothetical protein
VNDSDEIQTIEIPSVHLRENDVPVLALEENVDYVVTEDPTKPSDPEAWAVHVLTGEYEDWVIRYNNVELDKDGLQFGYETIFCPELHEGYQVVDVEIANYFGTILEHMILSLHGEDGGNVYLDLETGEKIDL